MTPAGLFALAWSCNRLQRSAAELWLAWAWLSWYELWLPKGRGGEEEPPRPSLADMYRETLRDLYESDEEPDERGATP